MRRGSAIWALKWNASLARFEIVGTATENATVRVFLGDRLDAEQSTEWLQGQVAVDARPANQLAAALLRALQKLQTLLETEISRLQQLAHSPRE